MADVLVAGGTGFIGTHLVRRLVANGDAVTVISLEKDPLKDKSIEEKISLHWLNLLDKDAVKQFLRHRPFDKVFNLAGYIDHTPFFKGGRSIFDQHFTGLLNILESLDRSRLKSFVQVGSSDEYGNAPSPLCETAREAPIAPYSMGKLAGTQFIQMLQRTESFPGVVARLFLVYGPGQGFHRFIPQIIRGCLEDRAFDASEGKQLRDFCYVEDAVQGLFKASEESGAWGEVINVASGHPVSIKDVVETIKDLCGGGHPRFGAIPYRPGESMSLYADISKARSILKWAPQTSLTEGLKKTIHHYRAFLSDKRS